MGAGERWSHGFWLEPCGGWRYHHPGGEELGRDASTGGARAAPSSSQHAFVLELGLDGGMGDRRV